MVLCNPRQNPVQDKFSPRQNPVQDKIQSDTKSKNFFGAICFCFCQEKIVIRKKFCQKKKFSDFVSDFQCTVLLSCLGQIDAYHY